MTADDLSSLNELLGDDSGKISTVNPKVLEVGSEIARDLLESGAGAWGILLGRGVHYTDGSTDYGPPSEHLKQSGPCVVTPIRWSGDRQGELHLVVPELGARGVVAFMLALMTGAEADPESTPLDEEGMDAYVEAVNNFLGSASQKLRQSVGGTISLEAGESKLVQLPKEIASVGRDDRICHGGQVTIEGMVPVGIHLLVPASVTGIEIVQASKKAKATETSATLPPAEHDDSLNRQIAVKLQLPVRVILAEKKLRMEAVQSLSPGSIIEFRKLSGELLDVLAGEVKFGEGEVVIINEHFGIQIKKLVDVRMSIAR